MWNESEVRLKSLSVSLEKGWIVGGRYFLLNYHSSLVLFNNS